MKDPYQLDLFTGIEREFVHIDDETFALTAKGDAAPVLDANKEDANHASNWNQDRSFHHVARIPPIVYEIWLNEHGVDALNPDHRDGVIRLLNDREWHFLRTGKGRL